MIPDENPRDPSGSQREDGPQKHEPTHQQKTEISHAQDLEHKSDPFLRDASTADDVTKEPETCLPGAGQGVTRSDANGSTSPDPAEALPSASRPMRAKILHKKERIAEAPTNHRSKEQRNLSKSRRDPRDTIENTLAAIRAVKADEEELPTPPVPKWMFWKR